MAYLLLVLSLAQSKLLAEYKLWKNYGQVIYDYSGNSLHGINGVSTLTNDNVGIFTDRGIYLSEKSRLSLPPNSINNSAFKLPSQYSIIFWVFSDDTSDNGILYSRYNPNMYMILCKNSLSRKPYFIYKINPTDTEHTLQGPASTWFECKKYLDKWVLVSFEVNINSFKVILDDSLTINVLSLGDIVENVVFDVTCIGSYTPKTQKSFVGFLAYFAIDDSNTIYSSYLTVGSSNCLIGLCVSCSVSFIIPGLGTGCGPSEKLLTKDADGTDCVDNNPCYKGLILKCNCVSMSCLIESSLNCTCLDYSTGISYSTTCNCISIGQGCCLEECESCINEDKCLTCKDKHSLLTNTGGCQCKTGFFKGEDNDGSNICQECLGECSECKNINECTECKDNNAEIQNGKCICKPGYYNNTDLSIGLCFACPSGCKECDYTSACLTCEANNTQIINGICECQEGFWYNTSLTNDKGDCVCIDGYFKNESNLCELCNQTCKTCENSIDCLTCLNPNYELVNGTKCLLKCNFNMERTNESCKCKYGYLLSEGICIQAMFKMEMGISKSNKIKLSFDQNLKISLNKSDVSLKISISVNYEFNFTEISKKYYLITLVFKESLPNNTDFILKLKEPILSSNGSKLENFEYEGSLFEYIYIPSMLKSIFLKTKAVTKSAITFSILSSLISNPAASWAIINSLQIIPYIPIIKSKLSANLNEFCSAIGDFNIIPNVMVYIFDASSASEPFEDAKKIGFTSSLFFINLGKELTIFISILLIWPLIKFLVHIESRIFSSKLKEISKNYKYSFFIRFWIQSSLDIGIYAIIQLRSDLRSSPAQFYFNQVWAGISIVNSNKAAFLLSSPIIFLFLKIFYEKLRDNETEFFEKYGSLFYEFKHNKGLLSSIYYVFFFIRRFQFLLTQIYFNSVPIFQISLNISFSFLYFVYLIVYRPFKDVSVMISYICAEFCLICNYCIVLIIVCEYTLIRIEMLEYAFISCVYFSMMIQITVVFYNNYLSLRKLIKKIRQKPKTEIFEKK